MVKKKQVWHSRTGSVADSAAGSVSVLCWASSYGGYGYSVTVTTTERSTMTSQDQIFQRLSGQDRLIYLTGMHFRRFYVLGAGTQDDELTFNVHSLYVEGSR